jgi:sugar phosphate permease
MPYRYRLLALLFCLVLVMYLDRLCIAVAGPRMQQDLHISPVQWGWVIGAFTLAYTLFEVPSGVLGDRIGPRRVLTRIVLWWSAFTSLTGAVSGFYPLLAVRFLFGAGEAGAFPNCACAISRWIPGAERGRANGAFWTATAAGGAITPFLVVWIEQHYSWRLAFYLFGALGVFWAALWYWWFRDSPWEKKEVSAEERRLIGHPPVSEHARIPWALLLRNRNFQYILLMYHTYCWGAYFYLSWLSTYLQVGRGLSEDQMKVAASIPFWAGLLGVLAGGYGSDWLGRRHSLRFARCSIGSVSLACSGICLLAAVCQSNWWVVALLTIGFGVMTASLPVSWSVCVDVGQEYAGTISGAMNMAGQAGSLISAVAFGYLVQWSGSYDRALVPLGAMLLVSGFAFARIDPSQPVLAATPAVLQE